MALSLARFCSLLFVGLALAPALAHLFELPNKIGLGRDEYLAAQHLYNGWALLGIFIIAAIVSTLVHAVLVRDDRRRFVPALVAFLCIAGTQAIFWGFTQPANAATSSWTVLPENWETLRAQWEYSHAASALLDLAGFVSLILSVLPKRGL